MFRRLCRVVVLAGAAVLVADGLHYAADHARLDIRSNDADEPQSRPSWAGQRSSGRRPECQPGRRSEHGR
jgi:hypothetical protein